MVYGFHCGLSKRTDSRSVKYFLGGRGGGPNPKDPKTPPKCHTLSTPTPNSFKRFTSKMRIIPKHLQNLHLIPTLSLSSTEPPPGFQPIAITAITAQPPVGLAAASPAACAACVGEAGEAAEEMRRKDFEGLGGAELRRIHRRIHQVKRKTERSFFKKAKTNVWGQTTSK